MNSERSPTRNTTLAAWLAEARFEALRVLRRPAYFVPVLVLPLAFFLMFGVAMARQNGGVEASLQALIGYGVYGVLAASVIGLAASVASEREFGLLTLKRALPVPPGAYLGAKVASALTISAVVNILLAVLALVFTAVHLRPSQCLAVLAIDVAGGLPFAAIGLFIGSRVAAASAPGVASAIYLPLSFLGGLWVPLQFLPPVMAQVARLLPSYHLLALALAAVGRGDGSDPGAHILVLAGFAAVFFALARQRLAFSGDGVLSHGATRWVVGLGAAAIAAGFALAPAAGRQRAVQGPTTAAPAAGPTALENNSFAIRGVELFDGEQFVPDANVVVRDGLIEAVGPGVALPEDLRIVEGEGHCLIPGLIDAHTHSFGTARRDALRFAVTTELDMFTDWRLLADAKRERQGRARTDAADLWSAGTLATVPLGHGTEYGRIPTLTRAEEAPGFVDARIAEGSDYIKIILEDGSAFGQALPTLDTPTLTALVAAAHHRGVLALAHVSTQSDARRAIDAGVDGLAHAPIDRILDDATIAAARAHHTFVVSTLAAAAMESRAGEARALAGEARFLPFLSEGQLGALHSSLPSDWIRDNFLANAIENVRRLHAAGVAILGGTDAGNPGTAHGASLHEELALLVRAGLSPTEALTAVTSGPARAFSLGDRGRIAKGLRADLVLLDGDARQDILATRAIAAIWMNGYPVDRTLSAEERPRATQGTAAPQDPLIADFEAGSLTVRFGQNWMITTDQRMNGLSTAEQHWQAGGANGSTGSLALRGVIAPGLAFAWAGTMFMPGNAPLEPVDFSARKVLVFRARGDEREDEVMVFSGEAGRGMPSVVRFRASRDWQEIRIPLSQFEDADLARIRGLAFTATLPAGPFAIDLDDVRIE